MQVSFSSTSSSTALVLYDSTLPHIAARAHLDRMDGYYSSQGQYSEALKLYDEAIKQGAFGLGKNHPDLAKSLHNMAVCYTSQGNYSEALKQYDEVLKSSRIAIEKLKGGIKIKDFWVEPFVKTDLHNKVDYRPLKRDIAWET